MEASSDQIKEYETQLADVQALLDASPEDAALLSLKKDLEELLALTTASLPASDAAESTSQVQVSAVEDSATLDKEPAGPVASVATTTSTEGAAAAAAAVDTAPKKKKLKLKDFEIPEHLKPKEGDTEAETSKKRRAVKKLKNKWREKKKEVESTKKQQSWQSFQSKKKRKDQTSIFATQDGSNARVGVISANSMTDFGQRKRHKHG